MMIAEKICKKYYLQKRTEVFLKLSSSGSSLMSWLTPGQVYEKSREDPEIGSVMGWVKLVYFVVLHCIIHWPLLTFNI